MSAMESQEHQSNGMVTATSKMSSRGQVVIPIEIRRRLGLEEGDDLTFIVGKNEKLKLKL